jgi:hypothetical protein
MSTKVTTNENTVNVTTSGQTVVVQAAGIQGPQGPTGADGAVQPTGSFAITGSNSFVGDQIITGSLIISGSSTFTNIGPAIFSGSITATAGITGSFSGTATSASFAVTASHALFAVSASHEVTFEVSSSHAQTADQAGDLFGTPSILVSNLTASGDVFVSQFIKHTGDVNTLINFTDNRIRFKAGDIGFFDMEKDASAPYPATINPGGNRVNFRVNDRNTNLLLKTDSELFKVNLYHAGNQKLETAVDGINVTGNISASGHVTASGNISASGNINGQSIFGGVFGRIYPDSSQTSNNQFLTADANGLISNASFNVTGNITSSGDISASGDLSARDITANDITLDAIGISDKPNVILKRGSVTGISLQMGSGGNDEGILLINNHAGQGDIRFQGGGNSFFSQSLNVGVPYAYPEPVGGTFTVRGTISSSGAINTLSHITASGNISAGGDIVANNLSGTNTGDQDLSNLVTNAQTASFAITGSDVIFSHITSSGNISASGDIIGGGLNINGTTTFNDGNITNVGNIALDSIQDEGQNGTSISLNSADIRFAVAETLNVFTVGTSGNVTASGNISASGDIIGNTLRVGVTPDNTNGLFISASTFDGDTRDVQIIYPNHGLHFNSDVSNNHVLALAGNNVGIRKQPDDGNALQVSGSISMVDGDIFGVTNITASGNISASSTIIANGLDIRGSGNATTFNDGNILNVGVISLDSLLSDGGGDNQILLNTTNMDHRINDSGVMTLKETAVEFFTDGTIGHITASGNISASGDIIANKVTADVVDTSFETFFNFEAATAFTYIAPFGLTVNFTGSSTASMDVVGFVTASANTDTFSSQQLLPITLNQFDKLKITPAAVGLFIISGSRTI